MFLFLTYKMRFLFVILVLLLSMPMLAMARRGRQPCNSSDCSRFCAPLGGACYNDECRCNSNGK
ncbi:hypothetical protein AAVH_27935 [Aphelenchoides avenae]|nr:hypothetical protein AAVH_27935 [Aphelenchus avenae]